MNALLTADKKENIQATGENLKSVLGVPDDPKKSSVELATPYKELDKNFFSKQRRAAVAALKRNRNFRTLLEVAESYLIKGVYPEAQSYYKQALEANPKLFIAYQRLKLIAIKRKDFRSLEENQRLLVKNSERRPDFLREYVQLRIALHPQERPVIEESLKDLNEIIGKEPNNASYLNLHGFVLLNFFQDIENAQLSFQKALDKDPKNIDANNNLGVTLMREKKFRDAIKHFESCIEISPKYLFSYQNLSFCYVSLGAFKDALAALKKASDAGLALLNEWQHLYGWLLIQTGDFAVAQGWYKDRIAQEPNNNLLYNNLGVCFLQLGKIEDATQSFSTAIRIVQNKLRNGAVLDPRDLQAFYNRGRAALDSGDRAKANEIRDNLTKINPGDSYALYLEGNNNLVKGKLHEALEFYAKSMKTDPLLPDPYPDVSFILECHAQDYQETIEILEGAISRGIKNHLILNNLAYAYIRAGELDKAEDIIRSHPENKRPELLATEGLLNFHRMNLKEGDRLYALAIERLKDHDKPMATQLWRYERALYFYKSNDHKEALQEAEIAKAVRSSYLNKNIQELIDKMTG